VEFLCQVAHLRAYALGFAVPEHGDCSCCVGGKHHGELLASAGRIQAHEGDTREWLVRKANPPVLNILQQSTTRAACHSCSSH
jgi:hypothetical protein